jgi:hypothetical protein
MHLGAQKVVVCFGMAGIDLSIIVIEGEKGHPQPGDSFRKKAVQKRFSLFYYLLHLLPPGAIR